MKTFQFNIIYVIESLPKGEPQTGTVLYNDTLSRKVYQLEWLKVKLIKIYDSKDLTSFFYFVENEIPKGAFPYFHFEMHGSNDSNGLILSSGELITWIDLADYCRPINVAVKNNLFLSLSVCFGANALLGFDITKPSPFYGIFAPWHEIQIPQVEFFNKFFDTLLETYDLGKSVILYKKFTNDTWNMKLEVAESIFEKVWNNYEKQTRDEVKLKRRVKDLVNLTLHNPKREKGVKYNIPDLKSQFKKMLFDDLDSKESKRRAFLHQN